MRIEYADGKPGPVRFDTLATGDTFRETANGEAVYLVTDECDEEDVFKAVNLVNGWMAHFDAGDGVIPVRAGVVVDGPGPR